MIKMFVFLALAGTAFATEAPLMSEVDALRVENYSLKIANLQQEIGEILKRNNLHIAPDGTLVSNEPPKAAAKQPVKK